MNMADRIQYLRKSKGISQEELADKVGVSRQAVSKWESEQSTPDLEKIINKEGVDISKLSEERKINLVQNLGTSMQSYIEINKIKNALKIFNNTKKNHVILSSSKYDLHLTGNNQLLEVECVPQLNLNKKNNKKMI